MTNPEIDWSNPAEIEAALEAEGLGVIGGETTAATGALVLHYAQETAVLDVTEATVRQTLARYEGDELGGAMAAHFTSPLAAELALDGVMGDAETEAVDELVRVVRVKGLEGITVSHIERGLGVNFELGGLLGLLDAREAFETMDPEVVARLRDEFLSGSVEPSDEEYDEDDFEADVQEGSIDQEVGGEEDDMTDDSGEEFEL